MSVMQAAISVSLSILSFLWIHFINWLYIFVSPVENLEVLWIIVPIWISWFFAEFFQEKKGTSFGNAITNGAVPFWVGIDWIRQVTNLLIAGELEFSTMVVVKYFICLCVLLYGAMIIYYGIKAKSFVHFIGRIRQITYILVMFTPIIYGVFDLNWDFVVSIIIFYPVFYYIIEYIDRKFPDPIAFARDEMEKLKRSSAESSSGLGGLDGLGKL